MRNRGGTGMRITKVGRNIYHVTWFYILVKDIHHRDRWLETGGTRKKKYRPFRKIPGFESGCRHQIAATRSRENFSAD